MNFIDNIVAALSPERAYRRESFRQALDSIRSYDAGSHSGINQNWRVTNKSAEFTDRYSRDDVRARARDLERNSDIMNATISAHKRNIVGGGYHVQAKTGLPEINDALEKEWKKWTKARNCDVTGTQSFNQLIRMAVVRKKVDGGILFVKRYIDGGSVPFKIQLIEVDELDNVTMTPKHAGNKVVGGIEYNKYNRAVGYWIKQYDIEGYSQTEPVWLDAKDVFFYFSKRRPSQLREMSDMAHTISRIRDVNEFMTAVSVKQRIEACLSVFIKRGIPTTGVGRTGAQPERVSYDGKLLSPGMIKELNVGDEVQVVNPSGQAADATSFAKMQQRLVGAGQGISYEAMSRDMSESNYSSARAGLIEDDLTYDEEKELLMDVLDEIYETFVISAVLCGAVNIKDFWTNKEMYLAHEWVQEPKPWIDPYKESNANAIALRTGQKTFKQIAAETGRDWRDQIDDIAEIIQYGKSVGVDMESLLFGMQEQNDGGSKDEEEDD